ESPSYGKGSSGDRSGDLSGEPGTAVPGCAAWMPPVPRLPAPLHFLRDFATSRETSSLLSPYEW
ncbi:MAG: hypothetical protein ACKO3T_04760, partial [Planctomycetaceae bacterium]